MRLPAPEPRLVHVAAVAAMVETRLKALPFAAYMCGLWAGCWGLSAYYKNELPDEARPVLDATLAQIRSAATTEANWSPVETERLSALWTQIRADHRRSFHGGIIEAIDTFQMAFAELAGAEPHYAAVTPFVYMAWHMQEGTDEFRAQSRGFRRLTHVYVEPDSFLGIQTNRLVQLCDMLEQYVRRGAELQPELIASTVYGT